METNRREIIRRLEREGWVLVPGGKHAKYAHPERKGRISVPRHTTISKAVAGQIAKIAGW